MGGRTRKAHSRPCISTRSDAACRLIVKLHDESGRLVAQRLISDKFIVIANGAEKRTKEPQSNHQNDQWVNRNEPRDPQPGPSAPATASAPWNASSMLIPPPTSVRPQMHPYLFYDSALLETLAPEEGPINGGLRVLLSGSNLPPHNVPVYARFGTSVANAVYVERVWWCKCVTRLLVLGEC